MAKDKLIYASSARKAILKADPKLAYCIDSIPGVDAVEVVRCKDCKRCRQSVVTEDGRWRTVEKDGTFFFCKAFYRSGLDADDFCSYGERRSDV